ncbi:MAG: hypothetical protein KUG77_26050 [Nannocystaceae bacterium]|nr:hypothetical protein [Nannocystaceae bacterium]
MWVAAFLVVGATLTVSHFYTLPRPETSDPAVAAALNSMRGPNQGETWMSVHVLYADCRCSQRIFEHLRTERRPQDVVEKVLLVGGSDGLHEQLATAGFEVVSLEREELAERFGLTAAPLFAVLDPVGQLRYLGGYTGRKQGLDIRDIEILAQLHREEQVDELPLFGCAVAKELQELLDPLRIKYEK